MILFLFYAAFVWYFCFRWRRHWIGFASVFAGIAAVWLLSHSVRLIARWLVRSGELPAVDTRLFDMLLGLEAVIVGVVGVFFACLPRERPHIPCRRCGYELHGLEQDNPRCPECGLEHAAAKVKRRRCPVCGHESLMSRDEEECGACRAAAIRG